MAFLWPDKSFCRVTITVNTDSIITVQVHYPYKLLSLTASLLKYSNRSFVRNYFLLVISILNQTKKENLNVYIEAF